MMSSSFDQLLLVISLVWPLFCCWSYCSVIDVDLRPVEKIFDDAIVQLTKLRDNVCALLIFIFAGQMWLTELLIGLDWIE
jgi:hypothetical protein